MSAAARQALWARLRAAGVTDGELPADDGPAVPWYVRAMVGAAAWIAAIFLIGAILAMLSGLFRSGGTMMVIGLLLCAAAFAAMRVGGENPFLGQFALAVSLAGQGMFIGGVFSGTGFGWDNFGSGKGVRLLVIAAFELGLLLAVPSYVHRALSTLAAALALGGALYTWHLGAIFAPLAAGGFALAALSSIDQGERHALWQPLVAGLALALVASIAASIADPSLLEFGPRSGRPLLPPWIGPAAMSLAFAVVIALLLRAADVGAASAAGLAVWVVAGAAAAAAWFVSGLLGAVILLLVAFAIGHEVLLGLGVFAVLATLSRYYYGLEASLLTKSASLCAAGGVLVAAWFGMRFFGRSDGETSAGRGVVPGFAALNPGYGGATEAVAVGRWRAGMIAAATVVVLAGVNWVIHAREALLESGRAVYLELAPVDPRSLLQGDYMALRFKVADAAFDRRKVDGVDDGRLVLAVDRRGVGTFRRFDDGTALAADESLLRYRVRNGRPRLATDAFFFEEGRASDYAGARYGLFRVAPDGVAILTRLADADRVALGTPPRR